jgi:hypothetical protein
MWEYHITAPDHQRLSPGRDVVLTRLKHSFCFSYRLLLLRAYFRHPPLLAIFHPECLSFLHLHTDGFSCFGFPIPSSLSGIAAWDGNIFPDHHQIDQQEPPCLSLSCSGLDLEEQPFFIPFLLADLLFAIATI